MFEEQEEEEEKETRNPRSSGLLRGLEWEFVTDVSGQNIGPIFKAQEVLFDCLITEDVANSLFRNVGEKVTFYVA